MVSDEVKVYLVQRTAGIRHSGRRLLDHLKGTYDLLKEWQMPEHVCLAGLFHSIYGTNVFRTQAIELSQRTQVIEIIGEEAERLAYIFCACNRPRVLIAEGLSGEPYCVMNRFTGQDIALTSRDLFHLLAIERANLMEQNSLELLGQVAEALVQVRRDEMLSDMRSSVSTQA